VQVLIEPLEIRECERLVFLERPSESRPKLVALETERGKNDEDRSLLS
jgi:hypothetical protein